MIEVQGLTKRYGDFTAVDSINFTAQQGRVTGFLGPNGAGKSTSMRMMCGLTRPTSGTTKILGRDYHDIPNPGRTIGVLLDASAQHAGRSGLEALTISAKVMGLPNSRVDEMLDHVGLTKKEAKRRVGNYSLGMRQRLGIANALLGDPDVLVLDEPANGLDPAGIRWMRGLLQDFTSKGGTALLSSHLLREVEVIADDLVMIGRGHIVASGTTQELLAGTGTVVNATDNQALGRALETAGLTFTSPATGGLLVEAEPEAVGRAAAAGTVVLTELRAASGGGLEDMFLQLTANDAREGAAA